jgi:hypothetical protein
MTDELTNQTLGAFRESLTRNNKTIRADRAESIAEDAELIYLRTIQDIEMEIKKLGRERDNLLDLSPSDKSSLILASDFDAKKFTETDLSIGIRIRELNIKLDILKERYTILFGKNTSN